MKKNTHLVVIIAITTMFMLCFAGCAKQEKEATTAQDTNPKKVAGISNTKSNSSDWNGEWEIQGTYIRAEYEGNEYPDHKVGDPISYYCVIYLVDDSNGKISTPLSQSTPENDDMHFTLNGNQLIGKEHEEWNDEGKDGSRDDTWDLVLSYDSSGNPVIDGTSELVYKGIDGGFVLKSKLHMVKFSGLSSDPSNK